MSMIRRLAPGLVGALALALLACSTPAAAPAKPTGSAPAAPAPTAVPARRKIEYGLVNFSAFYWPIYVGLDKGFFDREALDVETTETRSGSDGLSALAGGSL